MNVMSQRFGPRIALCVIILVLAWCVTFNEIAQGKNAANAWEDTDSREIEAFFSPDGGCAAKIVSEIDSARRRIGVQAYFFTSREISDALIAAAKRDVDVTVLLDASQKDQKYSPWRDMKKAGIRVKFDSEHQVANNKIILIDDDTIITGSYNYTKAAESKNAENIIVIRNDDGLFGDFKANFKKHLEHSR